MRHLQCSSHGEKGSVHPRLVCLHIMTSSSMYSSSQTALQSRFPLSRNSILENKIMISLGRSTSEFRATPNKLVVNMTLPKVVKVVEVVEIVEVIIGTVEVTIKDNWMIAFNLIRLVALLVIAGIVGHSLCDVVRAIQYGWRHATNSGAEDTREPGRQIQRVSFRDNRARDPGDAENWRGINQAPEDEGHQGQERREGWQMRERSW